MPSSARKVTAPPAARTPAASLDEAELLTIIGYQLAQAAVVTDRVFAEQVGGPQELRRLEFTLLALLNGNPGSTARQLARALAVTPPHIAAAVERLAQRGLAGARAWRARRPAATPDALPCRLSPPWSAPSRPCNAARPKRLPL